MNILLLILIGISLSIDTFSLALSLGTFDLKWKKIYFFTIIVAIFHFIMPVMGRILNVFINKFLVINHDLLLLIIFFALFTEMIINYFSKDEQSYDLSFLSIIFYAFSVSIDSLLVGIGISNLTNLPFLASFIFMILSFVITFIGFLIGKFSHKKFKKTAKIFGLFVIVFLIVIHLIKLIN